MRVLLARAAADAERSAVRVREAGFEPLVAPVLRIVAVEGDAAGVIRGRFDALVVTSRHAVPALATGAARMRDLPALAVGSRTAQALSEAGFGDVRTFGDAADLVRGAAAILRPGAAILHPAGRHRKAEPASGLERAGHAVRTWIVYDAEAVSVLPASIAAALRDGTLRAALHYSRRSAAVLSGLVARAGLSEAFGHLSHVCLSADVAAGLGPDFGRAVLAAAPTEDALLAELRGLPG